MTTPKLYRTVVPILFGTVVIQGFMADQAGIRQIGSGQKSIPFFAVAQLQLQACRFIARQPRFVSDNTMNRPLGTFIRNQ